MLRSATLKSNCSADFGTPPESPRTLSGKESPFSFSGSSTPVADDSKPPIPPPRSRRAGNSKLERLRVNAMQKSSSQDDAGSSSSAAPEMAPPTSNEHYLKGHLSMLVVSAKGLRQMMKVRWFVYDKKTGRLRYYRTDEEGECLGELDVHSATFCYDVQNDRNGEFTMW